MLLWPHYGCLHDFASVAGLTSPRNCKQSNLVCALCRIKVLRPYTCAVGSLFFIVSLYILTLCKPLLICFFSSTALGYYISLISIFIKSSSTGTFHSSLCVTFHKKDTRLSSFLSSLFLLPLFLGL